MVRTLRLCGLCALAWALIAPARADIDPQHLLEVSQRYVGIQERTGRNDGPQIEAMQRFSGGSRGEPYCIFFLVYTAHEAGATWVPRTGYTPTYFQAAAAAPYRITADQLQPGDDVGLHFPSKGRLAHGLRLKERRGAWWITTEANTSPDAAPGTEADRNGDGIWNRRRPAKLIEQRNNRFVRVWRRA